MTLRAALIDLDDTLTEEAGPVGEALLATAAGIPDPPALVEALRARARELWRGSPAWDWCSAIGVSSWEGLGSRFDGEGREMALLRDWVTGFRLAAWGQALRDRGLEDDGLAARLAVRYPAERRARHRRFPDALACLDACRRRGLRLGLLTNGAAPIQREKVALAGLDGVFDATLIAGEIGVGKPSPQPFLLLLERLGVRPDEAVMVGNYLHTDVRGAAAAGICSVWLNRGGGPRATDDRPDHEIAGLDALAPLLDRLTG